jgi:serine/threonine protein kinase
VTPMVIGRYEVKNKLGRGGMATVYLAFDPRFKRDVAIKVLPHDLMLDQMFRDRFEREAMIIANLNHPAVVAVFDYGERDDQPYLVMQHMPSGTLADRIAQGPIAGSDCQAIIERIASALDRAHNKGVIHRDLKPANILFDEFGDAFLADFGIAKMVESSSTLTGSGLIGTPAYMSPEQVNGERTDIQSDIYSLGVITFEMLTGQQPFHADTPINTFAKN